MSPPRRILDELFAQFLVPCAEPVLFDDKQFASEASYLQWSPWVWAKLVNFASALRNPSLSENTPLPNNDQKRGHTTHLTCDGRLAVAIVAPLSTVTTADEISQLSFSPFSLVVLFPEAPCVWGVIIQSQCWTSLRDALDILLAYPLRGGTNMIVQSFQLLGSPNYCLGVDQSPSLHI